MDWRLTAAVSAAAGSFCLFAIGAYVVLTHNPARQQQQASAAVQNLLAEYRFPVPTPPSLVPAKPPSPSTPSPSPFASQFAPESNPPFAPQGNSVIPVATSGVAVASGSVGAYASVNPPAAEANRRSDPK